MSESPAARREASVVCRRSWNDRPPPSSSERAISASWMRRSSSGWPGRNIADSTCDSLMTTRPPGRTTRRNSDSALSVSRMWWSTSPHQTQSRLPSFIASAVASPSRNSRRPGVEALAHQFARRLHALGGRLDPQHAAPPAHGLGEPERVEPDSAARVEPGRAGRQLEVGDEGARLGLLEIVHALEGLREGLGRRRGGARTVTRPDRGLSHERPPRRPARPPSRPSSASAPRA